MCVYMCGQQLFLWSPQRGVYLCVCVCVCVCACVYLYVSSYVRELACVRVRAWVRE